MLPCLFGLRGGELFAILVASSAGGERMYSHIVMRLDEHGATPERLELLSSALRRDLLELDVDDVVKVGEAVPPAGARAVDVVAIGELLVSLSGSLDLLRSVIEAVRSWVVRGSASHARTAELAVGDKTIKLTGVSSEQQDQIIEQFVQALAKE
jgi:hypothetical protein